MTLHKIDRPNGRYTKQELDKLLVFCLLDTAVPYEMVCKAFDALDKARCTVRDHLMGKDAKYIEDVLRKSGYRFPKQHAERIYKFSMNRINLKTCTREELVKNVNGIGMKLASMFLRNTRGEDYAVMDVHTKRWLKRVLVARKEPLPKNYQEEEQAFKRIAKVVKMSTKDLDLAIWQTYRRGNKSK